MLRISGISLFVVTALVLSAGSMAAADFSFWGIDMGQSTHIGPNQLTFTGVAGDQQFVVGGTGYTAVNGVWYGPFEAPSPGLAYDEHPAFDAQASFFRSDHDSMHFALIGGMNPAGVTFEHGGYGQSQFGVGDLYLSVGGVTYGVGLRSGGLNWVDGDHPAKKMYRADTAAAALGSVRSSGTLGNIEMNPIWYHADHAGLAPCDPEAYAFFSSGSGTLTGHATVDIIDTGVQFGGYQSYLYEVSIPWVAIGFAERPLDTSIGFHWSPDCGNDIIQGELITPVPEPALVQMAGILLGLCGLGLARYRK